LARRVDRLAGRRQCLAQYLPTEQLTEAQIFAPAAKQVFLDFLQRQQTDQIIQQLAHRDSSTCDPATERRTKRLRILNLSGQLLQPFARNPTFRAKLRGFSARNSACSLLRPPLPSSRSSVAAPPD